MSDDYELTKRLVPLDDGTPTRSPLHQHQPPCYGSIGRRRSNARARSSSPHDSYQSPLTPRLAPSEVASRQGLIPEHRLEHLRKYGFEVVKGEKAKEYEEQQEELLKDLKSYDAGEYGEDEKDDPGLVKAAIWISFGINVCLTVAKLLILIISGSVSVLASFLDSCLDLLSGSIIFIASLFQKVQPHEVHTYPVGKTRLETLAVLVFSTTMFTATGQLLTTGAASLIDQAGIDLDIGWITIGILLGTITIKLLLWFICSRFEHNSVQALAQDHRNDVLSNGIATMTALGGYYWRPWVDPLGGVIISLLIMYTWFENGMEQMEKLMGKSADPNFLSKLTYIAYIHDPRVLFVDTVRAYSVAEGFLVEVDIVLPPEMALTETHDIGESLQHKLEMVPGVERAFVHLDFEYQHRAHDEHKIA